MSYPTVVALDTDGTIWENYLDGGRWGKGRGANRIQEDNIDRVDERTLRDRTNRNNWIRIFNDISKIIHDILRNGAQLAIVSRNPAKNLTDRALYYYNATKPDDNKQWSIIHLTKYNEIKDESKALPFRRIKGWSASDYVDMVLYDDAPQNNVVRIELGVSFQLVRDKKNGLTWATYQEGINAYRRAKALSILKEPDHQRRRVLIGYSGLPTKWINMVRAGEGTVDRTMAYRWGYALYVAETVEIAKYFVAYDGRAGFKSSVCEIWVKDYDAWVNLNKIWIPEELRSLPLMRNRTWSANQTGLNQEDRDRYISNTWGVHTPYVLFSRHWYNTGMNFIPRGTRWTEMVVYTQVQQALIEAVPLTNQQVNQIKDPSPYPFAKQFKTWNITVPQETRNEFRRKREMDLYNASA